jgi:hypothetical protein
MSTVELSKSLARAAVSRMALLVARIKRPQRSAATSAHPPYRSQPGAFGLLAGHVSHWDE